ncbi:hypothetical protein E1193_02960 [Micromonospora sp. KC606]|uniref:hypothetical protein n=1 Tax=Micromonospora sp. KC606 TaxID=2530379 RepID=UPI001050F581|nr:hypothetical protein [Micromonospora sp. KC606]TDC85444.1 hypothetical protein E1193_02960 [Micromonospora sp. KC606]
MDWSLADRPLRLAPGAAVVPTADGFLLVTPTEDFITIDVEPGRRDLVASLLAGDLTPQAALARAADAAGLLDALADEGLLAGEEEAVAGPVVLLGDGVLVEHLGHLLDAEHTDDIGGAALVVACADWLPDARWRRLDADCAAAGVAWHRGYAEGGRWYAGPLSVPGAGPSYADLRLRRLAASPFPDQLLAYWAWLDSGGRPAGSPEATGAAVVAGLIAADVRAYLAGRPVPGERTQYGVDVTDGVLRRHPVLPVPPDVMVHA